VRLRFSPWFFSILHFSVPALFDYATINPPESDTGFAVPASGFYPRDFWEVPQPFEILLEP
jgi:hypothetical protein